MPVEGVGEDFGTAIPSGVVPVDDHTVSSLNRVKLFRRVGIGVALTTGPGGIGTRIGRS